MSKWTRPASVPFPSIWRRFDGKSTVGKRNLIPKFVVQDVPDDLQEELVQHMVQHFARDAPAFASAKVLDEPESIQDLEQLWRQVFKDKVVLVCLVDNWEELDDPSLPKIAGCNFTFVRDRETKSLELKGQCSAKAFGLVGEVTRRFDYLTHYGVNECLYAYGLSVDPIYRGQGVGLEILKARFDLGRAVGLKLTVSAFTNIASQKLAERVGLETLVEINYEDYKVDGEVVFKNVTTKSAKLMGARIE